MESRWWPIGLAVTALATRSIPAKADPPVDVATTQRGVAVANNEPALTGVAGEGQSRLDIVVPFESDVDGLEIVLDGALVPASSYRVAVPVDAGPHVLLARAPGRLSWSTQFRLARDNTTFTVTIPRLAVPLAAASTPPLATPLAVAPTPPARAPATVTTADKIERDTGTTERTIGLVLGGTGLAGIALGALLGFDARSDQRELRARCVRSYCPAEASGLDRFSTQAAVADTLLVFGLASSAAAAIVFLTAPSAPAHERRAAAFQLAPAVAPGCASVVASGKF